MPCSFAPKVCYFLIGPYEVHIDAINHPYKYNKKQKLSLWRDNMTHLQQRNSLSTIIEDHMKTCRKCIKENLLCQNSNVISRWQQGRATDMEGDYSEAATTVTATSTSTAITTISFKMLSCLYFLLYLLIEFLNMDLGG